MSRGHLVAVLVVAFIAIGAGALLLPVEAKTDHGTVQCPGPSIMTMLRGPSGAQFRFDSQQPTSATADPRITPAEGPAWQAMRSCQSKAAARSGLGALALFGSGGIAYLRHRARRVGQS